MHDSGMKESGPGLIGITMGCPVGIGPEIILRFLAGSQDAFGDFQPVVLGDSGVLGRCARELGLAVEIIPWQPGDPVPQAGSGLVPVLEYSTLDPDALDWGRPTLDCGVAAGAYIEAALQLLGQDRLAAMVTCPISKAVFNEAGYQFPGHTEMLAFRLNAKDYAMMMVGARLRVALVTIHAALADVPIILNSPEVLRLIRLVGRSLKDDFGIAEPRLAVAGLNPHAGEDGLFGDEEHRVITPAVQVAADEGWSVVGPLPPDTVFHKAAAGDFDAVVCMYHDQGLIPFKLLHFADGVNVTLGLPIVRTSVGHGTAYDIAGRGVADSASLAAAFSLAAEIAGNRRRLSG